MTAHALLAPSSAARWVACPGSVKLEALYPELTESEAAREGTAAHWALAEVLLGATVAEGQVTPGGVVLTGEMVEGAELVQEWYAATLAAHPSEPSIIRVEYRLGAGGIHPENWGTPDLMLWFPKSKVLHVLDYKFGHGWVEVFENWQLMDYAALAGADLEIDGLAEQSVMVTMTVAQPRSYHPDGPIRSWTVRMADLRAYWNTLSMAAEEAVSASPATRVSAECRNCKARHACPALQAEGLAQVDRSRAAVPFDLPPLALGIELADIRQAIKALEARETGLAGQAEALLKSGQAVPFWQLESKPGTLTWTVPDAEVLALGDMLGVVLAKAAAPITPTQAKAKGFDAGMLEIYAARPPTAPKLVARKDETARKIFK
jgi:hypothetical protein